MDRIRIEVYPDYIETILIALRQKANWHAKMSEEGDDVVVAWINQIIRDIGGQA